MRQSHAKFFFLGVLLLASPKPLQSAENCAGVPFVNATRPRAIEESAGAVGPQIFDTAPNARGFVLMANNYGLLTYDGIGWRLTALGRSAVAFSVATSPDGRMFAGGSRTFGEVVADPTGQLLYQPLESRLPPSDRAFSDVWQTLVAKNGVAYFRAAEKIIVLEGGDARAVTPRGRFSAAGLVEDVLYAHDNQVGLVTLGANGPEPIPGGDAFKTLRVTAIAADSPGSLLVGTQERGLFRFDLASATATLLSKAIPELETAEILSVRRLQNDQIAVGTLRNGLFMLDGSGKLLFRMDRDSGLPDNAILSLKTSGDTLWAGTSGGVAQILAPSPVQGFSGREGLPGIVESISLHEGSIYAATSQGVFRMNCGARAFEPTTLRKQTFALLKSRSLLAAAADGIYEIDGTNARLVRSGLARGLSPSTDPNRIWAATQTGVATLSWKGGRFDAGLNLVLPGDDAKTEGLAQVEATSVGEDKDGRVWIAFVTGRVISGVPAMRGNALELTDVRNYGASDGLISGFAEVLTLKDGIRIGTTTAVLKPQGEGLRPDAEFATALGPDKGAFRIKDTSDGGYWVATSKRPVRLARDGTGTGLVVRSTSILRTPAGSRVLDFLEVSPQEVWIGTDDGAFRYDPSAEPAEPADIHAYVRRVRSNQNELFSGGASDSLDGELPHLAPLRFEVSSSSLHDPSRNRFRFRLDGQDTEWSPWTSETRKDYTNLGPGRYRFRVETSDVYGRIGKEAGFSFVVATPWYRKTWAIALGLALSACLFYLALEMRTRALRNRQRELESIVDQKTAELREASFTDPLTGLRNRRYFAEVIAAEASLASRSGSSALHMFLVDLDHFKKVNDTHGHAAGDEILRQTAARLKTAMRTSDLIFRWGGEEFLIVARGAPDLPRSEIARRIVGMIGLEPFDISTGTPLNRTCSVGFASFPFYSKNTTTVPVDAVIELADLSLYRAKHTGRNRAVGVSPQFTEPIPGDVWKKQVLENLEAGSVTVEVIEGPEIPGV
jgi:diguanylate cyclase (GGDEF)-like protein